MFGWRGDEPRTKWVVQIHVLFHIDHTVHAATLTTNDLAKVRRLTFNARTEWHSLGLELGLNVKTLDAIKEDFKTNKERFTDMLKQWLDMKPTWESLIAALREETMGLNNVADKVEKEYEKLKNSATDGPKDERTGMLTYA